MEYGNSGSFTDPIMSERLDARYWLFFSVMALAAAVDFFDFFLAAFIMSKIGVQWQLTYGQVAAILLGTGIGSIIGSLLGGTIADRFGRRSILIWANILCGLLAGAIAFVPEGDWIAFAALRFLSGLALGASSSVVLAFVVERTPGRFRNMIVGLNMVAPSAGIGLAGIVSGILIDAHGWRSVAAAGASPILIGLLIAAFIPESVPWLIARGRRAKASAAARRGPRPGACQALPRPRASLGEIYSDRRRFWLVLLACAGGTTGLNGVYLWGPSILAMVSGIGAAVAGKMFAITSLMGVAGKLLFAFIPQLSGRRAAAVASSLVGAASLFYAATTPTVFLAGLPLLMVAFCAMALFLEGGYSNIFPFAVEAFPIDLAGRGAGLAQAGVGAAKILGPLSLTLIAGSGDVIKPAATAHAILPAFIFLGGCALLSAICCAFLPSVGTGRRAQRVVSVEQMRD